MNENSKSTSTTPFTEWCTTYSELGPGSSHSHGRADDIVPPDGEGWSLISIAFHGGPRSFSAVWGK